MREKTSSILIYVIKILSARNLIFYNAVTMLDVIDRGEYTPYNKTGIPVAENQSPFTAG